MDWRSMLLEPIVAMWSKVAAFVPNLASAVVILVVGWLVALAVAAFTKWTLGRTKLDNRLASWMSRDGEDSKLHTEQWLATGVYYLVMLFVLVAFFQALNLTLVTEPLNNLLTQVTLFLPRLLGAGLLFLAAWVVASLVRAILTRGLSLTRLDDRLAEQSGIGAEEAKPVGSALAEGVYWIVFILFLPAVLGTLALDGLMDPVQQIVARLLGVVPNLFAATVIFAVGWLIARIAQKASTNLFAVAGVDKLAARVKVMGNVKRPASDILGWVVYAFILLPVIISALGALQLDAITGPASNMLGQILAAIPLVLASVVLLVISYGVARLVRGLVVTLLDNVGFDNILDVLGFASRDEAAGAGKPSKIVGEIAMAVVMLLAVIEAASLLGFTAVAVLGQSVLVFGSQIFMGIITFALGLYVADVAGRAIASGDWTNREILSRGARVAILVLSGAMGLRAMGFANEIVSLAFGLLLGSVGVAVALAFGLGSREIAGEAVKKWLKASKA